MKPKNFPERKRQRQIFALVRQNLLTGEAASRLHDSRRGVRTKKNRTGRGRLVRPESAA